MKKIILGLLIVMSFYSNAQETEFTFTAEKGMTDFIVTPVEGKTAPEIYKKVIEWIKVTYKNPDKVILSTIENEYVRFEGSSDKFYSINWGAELGGVIFEDAKYQIEISIKNGKYKFDLISIERYRKPTIFTSTISIEGGWQDISESFSGHTSKESLQIVFDKDGVLNSIFINYPQVPIYFNNLNKSLSESIVSTVKKSDGW